MATIKELAELVLEVLELQKVFFKGGRHHEDMIKSMQAEGRLRRMAEMVLNPPRADLFTPQE
jgi:hypothetical protein